MLGKILLNKIVQIIFAISAISILVLYIYLPKVTEQNVIDLVKQNSETTVQQMKLTRAYYVQEIVGDIKAFAPEISFDYDHEGVDGKVAFPTSLVHDLSDRFSKNTGTTIRLYSKYPFKPKEDRVLSDTQLEALNFFEENDNNRIWVKRDNVEGKEVLRVAVPDYMEQQACVSCHNSHADKTWPTNMWSIGDKRGILEVITPIDDALIANNKMKNSVLLVIIISTILLLIVYSIFLVRREKELLDANDILDQRVKEEVEKNIENEKQLSLKNRSAEMGNMMAAIIHQWKQPLNAISMVNSSLEVEATLGKLDTEYLLKKTKETKKQIENMTSTMEDFKNFFKPQDKTTYNVNDCIKEMNKLVGKIYLNDDVVIQMNLKNTLNTYGYSNELSQVLINILNNARDIILEKDSEIKTIFVNTNSYEDKITISIKDCAGGISDEHLEKVFDPYFTTKSEDGGTGIGLDMSKNIILKVNGKIEVHNEICKINDKEYKGACFTITLLAVKN